MSEPNLEAILWLNFEKDPLPPNIIPSHYIRIHIYRFYIQYRKLHH